MRHFLLCFFSLAGFSLKAQTILYVNGLMGTYSMPGPTNIQQDFIQSLQSYGLSAKNELKFPASIAGEIGCDATIGKKNFTIGGFFNNTITQGQAGYADYSGYYKQQQKVYRAVLGVRVSHGIVGRFSGYFKAGYSLSWLDLDFFYGYTGSSNVDNELKFISRGAMVEPGIAWTYTWKRFVFRAQGGFELNFQGKTLVKYDQNYYLLDQYNQPALIDWTGVRLGASVGLVLGKKKISFENSETTDW